MKYRLLNHLICEKCGGTFSLTVSAESRVPKPAVTFPKEKLCANYCAYEKKNGHFDCGECCSSEVDAGSLACGACGTSFPIVRSIPRMLKPDVSADDHEKSKKTIATAKDYELINTEFADTMGTHVDIATPSELSDELFGVMDGVLDKKDIAGKVVLDAACGPGNYDRAFMQMGATELIGFDLGGDTIEMAYSKYREEYNMHFVQADFFALPLRPSFDQVICIGVLQHLKDPERAFQILCGLIKPGGDIFIWVYGKSFIVSVIKLLRTFTLKLPFRAVLVLSYLPAVIIYACNLLVLFLYRYEALSFLARFVPFKLYLKRGFWGIKMVIQDHLTVPFINFYNDRDLGDWAKKVPLKDVVISPRHAGRQGQSWRLKGKRI